MTELKTETELRLMLIKIKARLNSHKDSLAMFNEDLTKAIEEGYSKQYQDSINELIFTKRAVINELEEILNK